MCVGINIINDLGHQAPDVDRVGGRKLESLFIHIGSQLFVCKYFLHTCLGIVKISMNSHNICIIPPLGHHLLFLNGTYTVFGIKYHDARSFHISKTCQRRFPCITGGSRQDHNFIFHLVLLRGGGEKVRQDRQCHIFKSNGCPMEKFQKICPVSFHNRRDPVGIKFLIVGFCYTVL